MLRLSKLFMITLVSLIYTLPTIYCAPDTDNNDDAVVVLTETDLDPFLEKNDAVLVKFYADWCMHCKNLAPEYAKAAKLLKDEGSNILLAKVNADGNSNLLGKYNIEEFPTLRFFKKGVQISYSGDRKAEGIVDWCKDILVSAVVEVDNLAAELASIDAGVAFVASGVPKDSELYKTFEEQADLYRKSTKFYYTSSGSGKFEVHHPEDGVTSFEGNSGDELATFLKEESLPLFAEITGDNYLLYVTSGKSMSWFCGAEEDYKSFRSAFVGAARRLRSSVLFVWVDSVKFSTIKDAFAIETLPAVAHQTSDGRYIMESGSYDFNSTDSIVSFYNDVDDGKIPKSVRSEDEPEVDDGPVRVVVGKTLEKLFVQKEADVLLMVHAPHCKHCKNFMPVFEAFAEANKDNASLIVAKINGDANESPIEEVRWDSFPTLLFFKAGSTTPTVFGGERTQKAIEEFVTQNGGVVADVRSEL